jgi:hypothetical protein
MYHIANTVLISDSTDSDTNKEAIVNVFEEFIGCAVSSSIASLTCPLEFICTSPHYVFQKSNLKGFDREDSQQGDQSFSEHEPV